jgi:hypothetical protein
MFMLLLSIEKIEEFFYDYLDDKIDLFSHLIIGSADSNNIDKCVVKWSADRGVPVTIYPPKWYNEKGEMVKGAGRQRVYIMCAAATNVVFFYDGVSHGTGMHIEIAKEVGVPMTIKKFTPLTQDQLNAEKMPEGLKPVKRKVRYAAKENAVEKTENLGDNKQESSLNTPHEIESHGDTFPVEPVNGVEYNGQLYQIGGDGEIL